MSMLTLSLLVCAMMALTKANGDKILNVSTATEEAVRVPPFFLNVRNLVCPGGWIPLADRCFYHEKTKKSWTDAEKNCMELGGHLASIHNPRDHIFIQGIITDIVWIGGSACQEPGAWFWSDGSPMNFGSWCTNQPDNDLTTCCLQMTTAVHKCWDDMPCKTAQESICVMSAIE